MCEASTGSSILPAPLLAAHKAPQCGQSRRVQLGWHNGVFHPTSPIPRIMYSAERGVVGCVECDWVNYWRDTLVHLDSDLSLFLIKYTHTHTHQHTHVKPLQCVCSPQSCLYRNGGFVVFECGYSEALFRHELHRMSAKLGPDFLRSLSFTHEQQSRWFSAQQKEAGWSHVFFYSTWTPALGLITKSSTDIFVGVSFMFGTTLLPGDICILLVLVLFSRYCILESQENTGSWVHVWEQPLNCVVVCEWLWWSRVALGFTEQAPDLTYTAFIIRLC